MKDEKRFYIKESEYIQLGAPVSIVVDRKTGVNYLLMSNGDGTGVTPLLDENGKVVIEK